MFTAESKQCMTQRTCSSWSIFPGPYCCLVAEQVSYYLPGYLPPDQIFVPPARASDSIIMGAYAEQGLAFEGELQLHHPAHGQSTRTCIASCDCSAVQKPHLFCLQEHQRCFTTCLMCTELQAAFVVHTTSLTLATVTHSLFTKLRQVSREM